MKVQHNLNLNLRQSSKSFKSLGVSEDSFTNVSGKLTPFLLEILPPLMTSVMILSEKTLLMCKIILPSSIRIRVFFFTDLNISG